jgi:hypothetical protein
MTTAATKSQAIDIVEQKLESLRRCLRRIETKGPADAAIANDAGSRDAISKLLLPFPQANIYALSIFCDDRVCKVAEGKRTFTLAADK